MIFINLNSQKVWNTNNFSLKYIIITTNDESCLPSIDCLREGQLISLSRIRDYKSQREMKISSYILILSYPETHGFKIETQVSSIIYPFCFGNQSYTLGNTLIKGSKWFPVKVKTRLLKIQFWRIEVSGFPKRVSRRKEMG